MKRIRHLCIRTIRLAMCYLIVLTSLHEARRAEAAIVPFPPLIQATVDSQQQIYLALYPSGTFNPDLYPYQLNSVVTGTGDYTGQTPDGPFTLSVFKLHAFDATTQGAPHLTDAQIQEMVDGGVTVGLVYADISTSAATIQVVGVAVSATLADGSTGSRFLLHGYLSDVTPPGGRARSSGPEGCSENPADYTPPDVSSEEVCGAPNCEDDPENGKRFNATCLTQAQNKWRNSMARACRDYNDDIEDAEDDYVGRIAQATAIYVAALVGCAALGWIPIVGVGAATKCAVAASTAYLSAIGYAEWKLAQDKKDAERDYNTAVGRANTDFDFDVSQCCEDCPRPPKHQVPKDH